MKTLRSLNRTVLAVACTAFILTTAPLSADWPPRVNITPIWANAGVNAVFYPTSDPFVAKVEAFGVVQSPQLGSCIETGQLEARFPAIPGDPVIVNGTATFTSINGTNSLNVAVSGTASRDPLFPAAFFNAKYKITITGGTGAYASAKGLAEISEVIMFTSQTNATVTWNLKGFVTTPK